MAEPRALGAPERLRFLLLLSVFVIATCGLIYELIAGTLASYLLGDSVTQFSTIIGTYLFAMGIGSWLSQHIQRDLLAVFVRIEILVGLVGGFSAAILFMLFDHVALFRLPLYGLVLAVGILVGIEIPLLLRILKDEFAFKDLVARVFTFDYIGALFAALLFPLILVPHLGLIRTGLLFGMMNVGVALWLIALCHQQAPKLRLQQASAILALVVLAFGFVYSGQLLQFAESSAFPDTVIHAQSTPYQRIVLTKAPQDLRLFLNNNLQFSSRDEYRYHEALVHPGLASLAAPKQVLILGGGDGLAAREILKYPSVEHIQLVDLDPAMTKLFASNPMLTALNQGALSSPKLAITNADAFLWLKDNAASLTAKFDFIVVDFPDPSSLAIGKLYSVTFFKLLYDVVHPDGAVVVQSTSPFVARKSFWCIANTLDAAGFVTAPYHAYVPSFGEWGFVLAGKHPYQPAQHYPAGLRFVTPPTVAAMFQFPPDMVREPTPVNRLDNQVLVHYFDEEWSAYSAH